ncbi:transcription initiation factor TFIID subunit 5 [Selaginella moellendorffii]|uniref:transcription initiation factor TFIID subunit 5 n=1 Tax=Selaginella moellendorffii TaxID=88036 RepID=UPI000D1CA5F6|nr:transcription initiation factor TFIID subunit 5 [Selaginella moellendorffii]|eukprot:XP_024534528.1 transcription initiation factor TFIID subunit 5 [Selaginella moellendorffii]
MEEDAEEKVVLEYLRRKKYRVAEIALLQEQQKQNSDTSGAISHIINHSRADNEAGRYKESYSKLRNWVHSSLDLYKTELLRILYPVFVHCYMELVAKGFAQEAREFFQSFRDDHQPQHIRDLQKLEGVITPQHLQENETACTLQENKVHVKMCQYSFELLLQYLQSTESMLMLGIVNSHINLKVLPGQPAALVDDDESSSLPAKVQAVVEATNQKEIHWGILEGSLEDKFEKQIAAELEKADADKDAETDEAKKRAADGKVKRVKRDKAGKGLKAEPAARSVPRLKPELTMPLLTDDFERQALDDLRNRVKLGSTALPSVSCYTFVNTNNSLNCASISADGAYLAGGFSDSAIKLWDMVKMGEPSMYSDAGKGQFEGRSSSYIRLVGHAGPVYGVDFSPEGDSLLSASGDCTIRLWSTRLNANLACYKGHNYPVWDVQYSPVGHYFASASYDRTARVWSMDRLQPLRIMAGHLSDVDCVQWHVNCNYIATGSSDKTVRLWDVQTGECVRIFTGHRSMIVSIAMSPDGLFMASGDEDGAIMMWDLASSRCVTPLLGHTGCVWSLAFSGEGSILASGSADNTVRLWDVNGSSKVTADKTRRLRLLKTLPTKSTPIYTLRFSRRNLLFVAGAFSPSKGH